MKRIFVFILIIMILCSTTACGKDETLLEDGMDSLVGMADDASYHADNSSVGAISNAIKLSLVDQGVYDQLLMYSCNGNVSCYIDVGNESSYASDKSVIDNGYMFGDSCRQAQQTIFYAAGRMNGVTITFKTKTSGENTSITIQDGIINQFVANGQPGKDAATSKTAAGRSSAVTFADIMIDYSNYGTLMTMKTPEGSYSSLYSKIRSIVGDSIKIHSNVYKNSEYTVFIAFGANNTANVYGQWNGFNLQ